MKDFYIFASGSPFLTFFIIVVIGECTVKVISSICGIFTKEETEEVSETKCKGMCHASGTCDC